MNKCIFLGRLTRDPESKVVGDNNLTITNFTLAVNRRFPKEGEVTADFLRCVAFGKTAETINKYVSKGQQIAVTTRVQTRTWENEEGKKNYITEFIVEEFYFAESKKDKVNSTPIEENYDEDLPF